VILKILKIAALFLVSVIVIGVSTYFTITRIIKSEDTVVVPRLTGKEVVYVLKTLTDLGLNTKVGGSEYSSDVPINHVIFQEPAPGAEIKKGRDVKIIISKGASSVWMPNIRGVSLQQGRIILEENGLCLGKRSHTFSQNLKKDRIIAQVPEPGRTLNKGDCIDLLVSLGERPNAYMMPDLSERKREDAILIIEQSNLLLGDITPVFKKGNPLNRIVHQEPAAGYRVMERTSVNIEVNREPGKKSLTDFESTSGVALFKYKTDNGFLKNHIRINLNWFGVSNDLLDDFIKPGEDIWFLIPKGENITLSVFKDNELIRTQVYSRR
jgi:eukaryotic-like serine/threonine-protein kinase